MKLRTVLLTALLAVFSSLLSAQTINLITPNGGEVWQGCTSQSITWSDSGTSNFYSIDYSVDNGSSWTSIATFYNTTAGSYNWTVPNLQSTQVLIRVQDSNNALVEDISSSNFSIIAPLLLTSPNGGEVWEGGTSHQITWVNSGTSNYYNLDYSLNGGNTWQNIVQGQYNTSGTYNWTVPNSPSTAVLVRVTDYYETCKSDKSNFTFEITPAIPVISVTSPTNGSVWYVGRNVNIQWNSQFVISNQVQIEYTTNAGSSWNYISTVTENDGAFTWNVPNELSTNAQIRITDLANNTTVGLSNPYFSIVQPFINFTSPAGGSTFVQCDGLPMSWTAGGTVNNRFRLDWSNDGGATWNLIVSNNFGQNYTWSYPPPVGNILIRIQDQNDASLQAFLQPDLVFTPNPDIIITSPNGGESIEVGTTHAITWAAANDVSTVYVEYSLNNGTSWTTISTASGSTGYLNWNVPNTPSTQCLIRVREYYNNSCKSDISDAVFTIAPPIPVIEDVNPGNGVGYVMYHNRGVNITWNSAYLTSPFVAIDFSNDGGATYTNLISATDDDGSYTWTPTDDYSEDCRFRVREIGSSVEGVSENAVALREPSIEFTAPSGGATFVQCNALTISWTAFGSVNNRFRLDWSGDGGATWNLIVSNNFGQSYSWSYPPPVGNILLRVRDQNDATIEDFLEPDLIFTPNPDIIITSPNGGESIEVGTNHQITWVAAPVISTVYVEYSLNNGTSWTTISTASGSTGYLNWSVPNSPSTQCLIRVREYYNNSCKSDMSDAVFTIAPPIPVIEDVNPGNGVGYIMYHNRAINITWNSAYLTSPFVAIDFSNDGGATYTNLISATDDDGSYTWTPTDDYSEDCRFRVREIGSSVEGVSENAVALREPSIEFTAPSGGATFVQCNALTISWTAFGSVNNRFRLDWSGDGGATWNLIVSNNFGQSYSWSYPPPVGNILLRVRDQNDATIEDFLEPDLIFTPNPDIIITSPNGGESIEVGTNHQITWVAAPVISTVYVEYSLNNGTSWTTISTASGSTGYLNWSVPNSPSTQCLIRVREYYNNSCKSDISDAVFTIAPPIPVIEDVNPGNGVGYIMYHNRAINITWNSAYLTSPFVAIDFSNDGGATYTNLISATDDDGSYTWTPTDDYSEDCRFRVREIGSSVEGVSENAVALREPSIEFTAPSGGATFVQCNALTISWTAFGSVNNRFRLDWSGDGGATWNLIVSNNFGQSYSWSYPPPVGNILLRVRDQNDATIEDFLEPDLIFTPNPDIIITSPNGGESIEVGTNHQITWVAAPVISTVYVEYSLNNGTSWTTISTASGSTGYLNWNVPNTPSTQCLIRVREYYNNSCKSDISDAVFTIAPPIPLIEDVNPGNGVGYIMYHNRAINITWNSAYLTSPFVAIDFSNDGGATYTNLISATDDDGSYTWTPTADYSEDCRFRVREIGSSVEGVSENAVALREPTIEFTAPSGGATFVQCNALTISWTAFGSVNNRFRLDWSGDGGATWNSIVSNNFGQNYTWSYPPPVGNVLIRVRDQNDASVEDFIEPDLVFTPNSDIIVTSPNGGEILEAGSNHTITWAAAPDVSTIYVEYSLNNGLNWTTISIVNPTSGALNWNVPNTPSDQCLIRIREYYNNSCRSDYSNSVFSIVTPQPEVLSPNGGNTFYYGQNVSISWTDEYYSSSFVSIELSVDNGISWSTISAVENNDGSYSWSVPATFTTQGLIRVTDYLDASITDSSDTVFTIAPSVVVTSPNGDNGIQDWRVCTETTITWTSGGTSNYFRLYYSLDNGNTWVTLNSNYYSPGFNNTYNWVMPNSPTATALVRVEDRYNSTQVDLSDNTFTIAPAITILAPNGGEVLGAGQPITISWLNEGATNYYNLDYSTNGGSTWTNIAFNVFVPNGSYDWTVPANVGSNYVVRVTDNIDNCKSDVSDSSFEVSSVQQGMIVLNSPNGNEVWQGCDQQIINWNSIATSDYYDIEYSQDNGSTWVSIVSNFFSTNGEFVWTLPNLNSTNMLVRVVDHNSLLFSDESNSVFSISGPSANAGTDVTLCSGESTLLQGTGGITYSWSPAIGLSNPAASNTIANPTLSTTYTLTVTDSFGCTATDQVVITVDNGLCDIEGCLDPTAYNFNPDATVDNQFCLYTTGGSGTCATDVNADGEVNTGDLLMILGSFGSQCD